jgi:predicted transcriptional regulator
VSPTYQWTYSTQGNFVPNVFIDISNFISEKVKALKNYEFELKYNNNDLRSVASVINWNKHYGNVINTEYCEPYQQLFCKE